MKKLILIAAVSTLVGCGGSNHIACDDRVATDLALQIVKEDTAESLFKVIFDQEYGLIRHVAEMDYATFMEQAKAPNATNFANVVEKSEKILNSLRLTNIRLIDINKATGINYCAATLNDGKQDGGTIEYTTQKLKGNQVFVEVSL